MKPEKITSALTAAALVVLCLAAPDADAATAIVTDADATVWAMTWGGSETDTNYGSREDLNLGWNPSNNNMHAYIHFDLGALADPNLDVTEARLQVEWKNTPYDPCWTLIYAIMDEAKDWDLAALSETEITWQTAPQTVPFDETLTYPFAEEDTGVDAVTRLIGEVENPADYPNPATPAPIDLDVTDLVKWALGQNAAYSNFTEDDNQLTVCMRVNREWPFVDYYSKEYTPGDDSDAPRLLITQEGERILGDAHAPGETGYGCVDGADYTAWADNYGETGVPSYSAGGWSVGNWTEDDVVDGADYTAWADNYLQGCGSVPEPASMGLMAMGLGVLLRRRRP